MKRKLHICSIALLTLISLSLNAQTRSEFLDAQMRVVATAQAAKYSRDVTLVLPDSSYSVVVKFITGELMMEGVYSDKALDTEHGDFKYYYANGNPESQGRFKEGYKVGLWKRWNFDGVPKPDRVYPDEKFNKGQRTSRPARFPGGMDSLQKLVNDSLAYPKEAKERGLEGTVYVTFTIDETGEVKQPLVSDGIHYILDEEALRFVSSLPTWTPAAKNGMPIESNFVMPITFDLGGSDTNGTQGKGNSSKN
jgi:TonB family protein